MPHSKCSLGVTLPEMVVVLVIIGILTAAAAPVAWRWTSVARIRAALDQISTELYRARMLAVESGHDVRVVLNSDDGCIAGIRTYSGGPDAESTASAGQVLDLGTVCLSHTGDSILTFNPRGMLKPPTRSVYAREPEGDSLLISIAGRIRRSY